MYSHCGGGVVGDGRRKETGKEKDTPCTCKSKIVHVHVHVHVASLLNINCVNNVDLRCYGEDEW